MLPEGVRCDGKCGNLEHNDELRAKHEESTQQPLVARPGMRRGGELSSIEACYPNSAVHATVTGAHAVLEP